jgi:hypothetical protein
MYKLDFVYITFSSFDDGNSMTNALHWVATRPGAWQQQQAKVSSSLAMLSNVVFAFVN